MQFYDTNILLHGDKKVFNQPFYLSDVTLEQLETIKFSSTYDHEIKYKARQVSRWLANNTNKYKLIIYRKTFKRNVFFDIDSNDKKIIASAKEVQKKDSNLIFCTYDINCYLLATSVNLPSEFYKPKKDFYKGYTKIFCKSDDEIALFYEQLHNQKLFLKPRINEYLLLYNQNNEVIDKYKHIGNNKYIRLHYNILQSKMFGRIKPIDPYQQLAIDSFKTNQITIIRGAAGSGKSLLSLAYLFQALQKNEIEKIIIFCNTVATANSAKLGYYPGDRTEKLLDSQIGNFLISKLGAREMVVRLIEEGQLVLLPMSDIRGYDTSGMKAGIYITQAQNLDISLLKLALQRAGEDCLFILDGDDKAQVDLSIYAGNNNGMKRASQVFRGKDFYGQVNLQVIHRSRIAQVANLM